MENTGKYMAHHKKMIKALENEQLKHFREEYLDLHPYEQSMFFMEQSKDNRMKMYAYLSPDEVADIMEHIDLEETKEYITEMDPRFASMVFAEMATDDAVDILNGLEKDKVASFLTIMDSESAEEIKQLLHYEEKTAGSIMTTEFVSIDKSQTVQETMRQLKREGPDAETIYYLYVVDEDKQLVGVLSLRDLIVSDEDTLISDIMSEKVVAVSVAKDQEEIASMMRDYDFLAVPVVDFQNHLLGIITV